MVSPQSIGAKMYLVIQKGCAIFGYGLTPCEAVNDMRKWIGSDSIQYYWNTSDFPTSYENANIGEFVLVKATDELLQDYL